jgi:radical SAM superfamily enzyme YgiQ (UPF0313 family)
MLKYRVEKAGSMKVQLFVPPKGYVAQRWSEGTSMPPLGVLSLAAVLEQADVEVEVVPADVLDLSWKDVEDRIQSYGPDVVGATTTTENRFDSFRLVSLAKRVDPGIVTVLGGPHMTMAAEDAMLRVPDLDLAVVGEGEVTLLELVRALESGSGPGAVKGVFHRIDGRAVFTGKRPRIEDLDVLPMPARHLIPIEHYRFEVATRDGRRWKAQNIMTSRGCPFDCYFCATPVNWGRRMRGFSPERVVDEIEHLITRYGAEYIWFYDDTLNYDNRRLHVIMDKILERRFDIRFCSEFRVDNIDRVLLEKMVRAGLAWGHFGIEAGSERVRRDIVGKKFDIALAEQFVRWAGELGFVPDAFLIFSHYTETWEEARETIRVMDRLKTINPETEFATALLHVYPGTPLERIARENGFIPADFSWAQKKDLKRVRQLPAAQGFVPLFKDRLNWFQIASLVMSWSGEKRKLITLGKIKEALRSITSLKSLGIYFVFFLTAVGRRLRGLWRKAASKLRPR